MTDLSPPLTALIVMHLKKKGRGRKRKKKAQWLFLICTTVTEDCRPGSSGLKFTFAKKWNQYFQKVIMKNK